LVKAAEYRKSDSKLPVINHHDLKLAAMIKAKEKEQELGIIVQKEEV
jgi:hypothetical protein